MSIEDFSKYFTELEICHLGEESLDVDGRVDGKRRLSETIHLGAWNDGLTAGGCINFMDTFTMNPQYHIKLYSGDPDDNENLITLIIGLRKKGAFRTEITDTHPIGFFLYKAPRDHRGLLTSVFLQCNRPSVMTDFSDSFEVVQRLELPPGDYVLIPSTYEPHKEFEFMLRFLTLRKLECCQLDAENMQKLPPREIQISARVDSLIHGTDQWLLGQYEDLSEGGDQGINANQLCELMNASSFRAIPNSRGFSLEFCRSIICCMDIDQTGRIRREELVTFWNCCEDWKRTYLMSDVSQTGTLSSSELRQALGTAGFQVSNLVFEALFNRYSDSETLEISFEDFVHCCIRLKTSFEVFAAQPKNFSDEAVFTLEDFLRLTCYT